MNSMERVVAAIRFEETDRVPVVAQVFGHAGTLAGVPVQHYVRDGKTIADCQLAALEHYGYDAVFSVMDVNVEAEACGARLEYRENMYPTIERYALSANDEVKSLQVPDPSTDGRMPQMLEALAILRHELRDEVPIVGCVLGPFTLATQLLGIETTLYMAADDPARLVRLLDFATDVVTTFGLAQLRAGAHLPIVFNPSASPAVVPPQFFKEFELPRLERVFHAFSAAGSIANWLHIAGPVAGILGYYPSAGVNLANFDYPVDARQASAALPATCLDGSVKPLTFVDGTPDDVAREARKLLETFRPRGGFILSSGCEIPPESRPENIAALVHAVVE